ncbi:MAG: MBL fold metallo-hydrolase [Gemmatimonadaceae bacterium]
MPLLSGERLRRANQSNQFRDGKFFNPSGLGPSLKGPSLGVLREFFFGGKARVPRVPLPVESPLSTWATPVATGLRITWMGHSTLYVECDDVRILIDPVFGERASPVSFAGPKRFHPVPATIEQLPPVDVVLLSHDHHDHLCPSSIRTLAAMRVPIVTSLGVGTRLERFGYAPELITELDWWETHAVSGTPLTLVATPAQHFSGRGLTDRNRTLWSSWVIATPQRRLFFSADTGLTEDLKEIRERFGPFEVCMIEIGAWHPAWTDVHLGPGRALTAFEFCGGGTLLPIHWATFDLALHKWDEPAETLLALAEATGVRVLTPPLGRPIEPSLVDRATPWWRDV